MQILKPIVESCARSCQNGNQNPQDLNIFYPLPNKTFFKKEFYHAVKDVNFSIPRKSTIGLVGESGSGKSTLGKALAGLINYQGSILYGGIDIGKLNSKELKSIKKDIQIVFQDPYGSLSPRMTIGEIVGEGLDVHFNLSKNDKDERIAESLIAVEINPSEVQVHVLHPSLELYLSPGLHKSLSLSPKSPVSPE